MFLYLDYETWSPVSLRKHGVDRYMRQVRPLILTWGIDDGPVTAIDFTVGDTWPKELRNALFDPKVILVAHNAWFDRNVMKYGERVEIGFARWWCTQAQAQAHSLPGSLEMLGLSLGFDEDHAKMKDGRRLIQKFCVHTKPYPEADKGDDTDDWIKFIQYAIRDTETMRLAHQQMPRWNYDIGHFEHQVWQLDQEINTRGLAIDLDFAEAAVRNLKNEKSKINDDVNALTGGAVEAATQRDRMLNWLLDNQGCLVENMRAGTLEKALSDENLDPATREVIQLRLQGSKTSTSKFQTILNNVGPDGRLRGTLNYAGAGRTARWAGRMFQPHNLPRPDEGMPGAAINACIELIKQDRVDDLVLFADNLSSACSNGLRGLVVAPDGKQLVVADWSNIEGRGLAWLAGEAWKLAAFKAQDRGEGQDLYKLTFSKAFSVGIETVTKFQRQQGKGMELSMGYGGGVGAFCNVSAAYGLDLDELGRSVPEIADPDVLAKAESTWQWAIEQNKTLGLTQEVYVACEYLKRVYRSINAQTAKFWHMLEDAAKTVIAMPGERVQVGYLTFACNGKWLLIQLPSGRYLSYALPKLHRRTAALNGGIDGRLALSYMAYRNKRWSRTLTYGGKLAENATQALARDILAHAMIEATRAGFKLVLHVHDEIVAEEVRDGGRDIAQLSRIMTTNPPWAKGLPLAVDGEEVVRYGK